MVKPFANMHMDLMLRQGIIGPDQLRGLELRRGIPRSMSFDLCGRTVRSRRGPGRRMIRRSSWSAGYRGFDGRMVTSPKISIRSDNRCGACPHLGGLLTTFDYGQFGPFDCGMH